MTNPRRLALFITGFFIGALLALLFCVLLPGTADAQTDPYTGVTQSAVTMPADMADAPPLPATGTDVESLLLIGFVLVVVGGLLYVGASKRFGRSDLNDSAESPTENAVPGWNEGVRER